jgi:protein SCO1/2
VGRASEHRLACLLVVAAVGCVQSPAGPQNPAAVTTRSPPAAAAAPSPSVFERPWIWSDEGGTPVALSRWRGNLLVVTLFFTSCTTTCPVTVDKLLRLGDTFRREGRAATFVLVTLDPSNDKPAELRRFKTARGLPPDWHLLRGNDQETRELADFLGIRIMNEDSHIVHDGRIVFLDPQGRLLGQYRG